MLAGLGIYFSHRLGDPRIDGLASISIGLLLAAVAVLLAYESRCLLLGESADRATVDNIRHLTETDPSVERAGRPLTMHFGPNDILLNLDVQLHGNFSNTEVAQSVGRLEKRIREAHPDVKRIFIESEALIGRDGESEG